MWRCSVCSFSNEDSTGQCGRCQIENNPQPRNPWGLRKGRSQQYWASYDWDAGNQPDFPKRDNDNRTITEQHQHHNTNIHDRYVTRLQSRDNLQRGPHSVNQPYPFYPPTIQEHQPDPEEQQPQDEPPVDPPAEEAQEEPVPQEELPQNTEQPEEEILPEQPNLPVEEIEEPITEGNIDTELEEPATEDIATHIKMGSLPYSMVVPPGHTSPVVYVHPSNRNYRLLSPIERQNPQHIIDGMATLPRGIVLVDVGGMEIPFYSSSGTNLKYDHYGKKDKDGKLIDFVKQGDWEPLFGMSKTWYNKSQMGNPWKDGWGVPELAEIQKWLNEHYNPARIHMQIEKGTILEGLGDLREFFSRMFIANYPPLPCKHFEYSDSKWNTTEGRTARKKVLKDLHTLFGRGTKETAKELPIMKKVYPPREPVVQQLVSPPPREPVVAEQVKQPKRSDIDRILKQAEEAGIEEVDIIVDSNTGEIIEVRLGNEVVNRRQGFQYLPVIKQVYDSFTQDEEGKRVFGKPCKYCGNYHDKRLACPIRTKIKPKKKNKLKGKNKKNQNVFSGGGGGGQVPPNRNRVQVQRRNRVQVRQRSRNNPPRNSNMKNTSSEGVMQTVSPVVWAPASEPPTKLAVFDIDDTLLDTSQRMRSAIRMGLFDPTQKGSKSHPKGVQAFRDFFYSPERFGLDKLIPGALDLVNSLQQQGYTIAYCTGRPRRIFEATKNQLRRHGFPIMRDKNGFELLSMKPDTEGKTTSYKFNVLRDLQHRYDVRMFFDNHPGNLAEAQKLGIPGLYISIDQYAGIAGLANRFKQDKRKVLDDIKRNPVAFPIPESYKERLAKQLGEEMTSEGYRPLEVQEHFIDSGAYHGNKSDFAYVQGEYQEFLDEIEAQDWDEAYAEYSDVESHLAYYMYTNYGISMPVYTHSHIRGVLFRVKLFEAIMKHFKLKFDPKYLVNGSNYKKVFKVRMALELAANDQNKKMPNVTDEELMEVVNSLVEEVKQNPPQSFAKSKVNDSIKGTKIQKKPDPETGNNCHNCAYWKPVGVTDDASKEIGLCSLWSDKVNREVLAADTFYCQGWKPDARDNPGEVPSNHREAAGVLVFRDGKLLILQRSFKETSKHGLWELPGGKVEKGETAEEAAVIEAKEEAGLDVTLGQYLGPHHDYNKKKTYHGYLATAPSGQPVTLSEEHSAYKWATLDEISAMPNSKVSHHLLYFLDTLGTLPNPNYDLPSKTPLGVAGDLSYEQLIGRTNPLPKPKKGMKKPEQYVEYLMGHTKMRTEFPDRRQRYAVALSLVEKNMKKGRSWARHRGLKKTTQKKQLKRLKGTAEALNNPGGDAIELYESFNGQPPDVVKKTQIGVPSTLVRIGEGGCWSVGYRSNKEGHGEDQKYIHNFGDFGRFPKKKPKDGKKEPDLYAAMDESGNVLYLVIMGGTFSLETDPDSGVNWLVG